MTNIPLDEAHIRIARPSQNLAAAERFWTEGVGLEVLWRTGDQAEGGHRLTMVGLPAASWHLELVDDPETAVANPPGPEDLLVVYLGEPPAPEWLARIEAAGGRRTPARNPYWDRWGVTVADPDGYLLVLSRRLWVLHDDVVRLARTEVRAGRGEAVVAEGVTTIRSANRGCGFGVSAPVPSSQNWQPWDFMLVTDGAAPRPGQGLAGSRARGGLGGRERSVSPGRVKSVILFR